MIHKRREYNPKKPKQKSKNRIHKDREINKNRERNKQQSHVPKKPENIFHDRGMNKALEKMENHRDFIKSVLAKETELFPESIADIVEKTVPNVRYFNHIAKDINHPTFESNWYYKSEATPEDIAIDARIINCTAMVSICMKKMIEEGMIKYDRLGEGIIKELKEEFPFITQRPLKLRKGNNKYEFADPFVNILRFANVTEKKVIQNGETKTINSVNIPFTGDNKGRDKVLPLLQFGTHPELLLGLGKKAGELTKMEIAQAWENALVETLEIYKEKIEKFNNLHSGIESKRFDFKESILGIIGDMRNTITYSSMHQFPSSEHQNMANVYDSLPFPSFDDWHSEWYIEDSGKIKKIGYISEESKKQYIHEVITLQCIMMTSIALQNLVDSKKIVGYNQARDELGIFTSRKNGKKSLFYELFNLAEIEYNENKTITNVKIKHKSKAEWKELMDNLIDEQRLEKKSIHHNTMDNNNLSTWAETLFYIAKYYSEKMEKCDERVLFGELPEAQVIENMIKTSSSVFIQNIWENHHPPLGFPSNKNMFPQSQDNIPDELKKAAEHALMISAIIVKTKFNDDNVINQLETEFNFFTKKDFARGQTMSDALYDIAQMDYALLSNYNMHSSLMVNYDVIHDDNEWIQLLKGLDFEKLGMNKEECLADNKKLLQAWERAFIRALDFYEKRIRD